MPSTIRSFTILLGLLLAIMTRASPQAPSSQEQQYLFSVLPLIEKGQLHEAEGKLLEGLRLYPSSAILNNALGIVYQREENFDAAIRSFQEALTVLPHFTAAQLHLALLYQRQDRRQEAIKMFNLAASETVDLDALSAAGLGLAQCEEYAGAIRALEKARSLRHDSVSVAYNLALAYFKSGDLPAAKAIVEATPLRDQQREVDVIFLQGQIKEALNEDGSKDMAQACRLSPTVEHICTDAGLALIRRDRLIEAEELLRTNPENARPSSGRLSALGLAQFRLGKYADAIAIYKRVLDQEPEADEAREGLSFLLYMVGDLSQAGQVAEAGLQRDEADFYLFQIHALILYRLSPEAWDRALLSLNRAIAKNHDFAPSYFLRGKIAMERGQFEGALRDFEEAARLDPKYPLPHYKIAQILSRQGKAQQAETSKKRFFELGQMREEELMVKQTQDVLMRKAYR